MNSTVKGTQKTTSAIEGIATKAGNRENLALGVTEQVGMDNPQGNTVAIVKCILKGNSNCIIIYYFSLGVIVFK